jgi:uncharacterized membrane protein SirB2
MNGTLTQLAQFLGTGWLHDLIVSALRNVWGLPPIVQSVHILSIACVMASIVMIDLRALGWAVPSQSLSEMKNRLTPWFWSALVLLFLSGVVFVIARPRRYFANPIFGYKFLFLFVALVFSVSLLLMLRKSDRQRPALKLVAAGSLLSWLGVMLAGRWIAYADYLIDPQ